MTGSATTIKPSLPARRAVGTSTATQPVLRTVYLTDPTEPAISMPLAARLPVAAGALPVSLLAALGERLAAGIAALPRGESAPGRPALQGEVERLERLGLQLQELAHIVGRVQQLRRESVDLGLALLQTVAEWSAEAGRLGVELHGPAGSVMVTANPAALKHLLDLMVEHALQQGRTVRLAIEAAGPSTVLAVASMSSEPASAPPARDTLAWLLLQWLARALGVGLDRAAVERGERVALRLTSASA
ncbi:MAG: HAMP domain-containing histidine kinase [Rubrivivax sp.]|nr:HAMP domain-containing histidine kinase [Rubrivivax sp.]